MRIDLKKKIEMYAGKFLKDGYVIDGDLVVKFSGDSTNITKHTHKLTNITFSFINFTKRVDSLILTPNSEAGSFIIGILICFENLFRLYA